MLLKRKTSSAAAHVLLDMISAHDLADDEDEQLRLVDLAARRMQDLECITADYDPEANRVHVDVTLLGIGVFALLSIVVDRLQGLTGQDRATLIVETREALGLLLDET